MSLGLEIKITELMTVLDPDLNYMSHGKISVGSILQAVEERFGIATKYLTVQHSFVIDNRVGGIERFHDPAMLIDPSIPVEVLVSKDFVIKKTEPNFFNEDMTNLMKDSETADFTLKLKSGKSFQVHKAILGARCRVFRAMFLSGKKEALDGEAVIEDEDIDEETLEEVLHYFYTGKLSGKDFDIYSLCYAADKYMLDPLKTIISKEFKKKELDAENVAVAFVSAEMFRNEELYKIAMEKLMDNRDMMKDPKFEEMLKKYPALLYKLFLSTNNQ